MKDVLYVPEISEELVEYFSKYSTKRLKSKVSGDFWLLYIVYISFKFNQLNSLHFEGYANPF